MYSPLADAWCVALCRIASSRLVSSCLVSSRVVPCRPVSSRRISSCFVSPRLMSYGIVAWHSACAYSRVYLLSSVCNLLGVVASQSKAGTRRIHTYILTYMRVTRTYARSSISNRSSSISLVCPLRNRYRVESDSWLISTRTILTTDSDYFRSFSAFLVWLGVK